MPRFQIFLGWKRRKRKLSISRNKKKEKKWKLEKKAKKPRKKKWTKKPSSQIFAISLKESLDFWRWTLAPLETPLVDADVDVAALVNRGSPDEACTICIGPSCK